LIRKDLRRFAVSPFLVGRMKSPHIPLNHFPLMAENTLSAMVASSSAK
jgi:hypothetical protein